ncbi:unnamed protein product [Paramecium sonneborni]|nr:unnamed protein product [Paramecium sonneborni]
MFSQSKKRPTKYLTKWLIYQYQRYYLFLYLNYSIDNCLLDSKIIFFKAQRRIITSLNFHLTQSELDQLKQLDSHQQGFLANNSLINLGRINNLIDQLCEKLIGDEKLLIKYEKFTIRIILVIFFYGDLQQIKQKQILLKLNNQET